MHIILDKTLMLAAETEKLLQKTHLLFVIELNIQSPVANISTNCLNFEVLPSSACTYVRTYVRTYNVSISWKLYRCEMWGLQCHEHRHISQQSHTKPRYVVTQQFENTILLPNYNAVVATFCLRVSTAELHLSRLIERTTRPVMQKIRVIEFFSQNRLHWQFEVGKYFYKRLFYATYLFMYK